MLFRKTSLREIKSFPFYNNILYFFYYIYFFNKRKLKMIIIHLVLKLNILPSLILLSVLVHTVISISIKKEIVVYLVGSFQQNGEFVYFIILNTIANHSLFLFPRIIPLLFKACLLLFHIDIDY